MMSARNSLILIAALTIAAVPAHAEVRIGLAAPLTGPYAWGGGSTERGAEAAVADLNAGGGVLGEPIELITADDYCDGEQPSPPRTNWLPTVWSRSLVISARVQQSLHRRSIPTPGS
jgi:Periplasmic binding protein